MSAGHELIKHEPRRIRPPYDIRDDAFDHVSPDEAWRLAVQRDRVAALREPLNGLEVTEYEQRQLDWLAHGELGAVAVIAGLLHRARAAAPLNQPEWAPKFATATQRRIAAEADLHAAAAGQAAERDRCAHILRAEIADAAEQDDPAAVRQALVRIFGQIVGDLVTP
jgi:hypothetical protein